MDKIVEQSPIQIREPATLYGHCMEADTIGDVLNYALHYIRTVLRVNNITYLVVKTGELHCEGSKVSPEIGARMVAHAQRCREGVGKTQVTDIDAVLLQNIPLQADSGGAEAFQQELVWTGSVLRNGRLVGVITLYGAEEELSDAQLKVIRETRRIIGESIERIEGLGESKAPKEVADASCVDMFIVTLRAGFEGGDVTGLVMSQLQRKVADRLASKIPAFMVAKLGLNRLMVVGNPGQPLCLGDWKRLCIGAIRSLEQELGISVEVELSEGDMESIGEAPIYGLVSKPSMNYPSRAMAI